MNLQLQGDDLNLIKTKSVISASVSKLLFFKRNLTRAEFYNFPTLCEVRNKGQISEEDIEVYWRHLQSLHQDFIEWFQDILCLEVPYWKSCRSCRSMRSSSQNVNLDTEPSGYNVISHVCSQDCGLYVVAELLTKKRNKLQIANQGDLRLRLNSIEPNVEKLL
uniref:Uncharacterized protein n=1 Tax=Trichuris muris TaxID=70415 RepID=A0A5S6PYX6_TRIMR